MVTWVVFLGVGLVIGVIAGLYFARLDDVTNSQKKALQQKLDEAESQINSYKSQVSEHFLKTATLVNSMTESYKAVHEHLALGARDLCDVKVTVEQLEMPDEKLIDVSTTGAKEQAAAEVKSQTEPLQPTAPPVDNDAETLAGHTGSVQSVTEQSVTEQPATEHSVTGDTVTGQMPQPSEAQAGQSATVEAEAAQPAEVTAEEAATEESVEAPIEPPSTPESLHVDEEESASSSISDVEQSQTNASRMVH